MKKREFSSVELSQLFKYACALIKDRDEALDLLQSCLLKWLERDTKDILNPKAYMMRMIRNAFYDRTKKIKTEIDIENIDIEAPDWESWASDSIDIEKLMSSFDPLDREVLYLWAYEGMSYEEISRKLDIAKGTLLARIHRLKKRFINSDSKKGEEA